MTVRQTFELPSDKLLQLIRQHGDPEANNDSVVWFVAYQVARGYCDVNTTKDWAHMFRAGIKPLEETLELDIATHFYDWSVTAMISCIHEFYGKGT